MRHLRNCSFAILVLTYFVFNAAPASAGCDAQITGSVQLHDGYDPFDAIADCLEQAAACEQICMTDCGESSMGGNYSGCESATLHETYIESRGTCYCSPELY